MADFVSKQTPDGRWQYGYGQYTKSIGKILQEKETSTLVNVVQKILSYGQALSPTIQSYTTITVYYVWAKVHGKKYIGGQWTEYNGGRAARDSHFRNVFEPQFIKKQSDLDRIHKISMSQIAPAIPTKKDVEEKISGRGYFVPILIAAGLALFIILR